MNSFYRLSLAFLVLALGWFLSMIFFFPGKGAPSYWVFATTGTLIVIATILGALGVIAAGADDK